MEWRGYEQRRLVDIVQPVDIFERRQRPHVIALAANIAALGDEAQNAPVVQAGTGEIISGRDRFAAAVINGRESIWVHVADATPEERADMEESENLFRRPVENRAELLAKRVARVEAVIKADAEARGYSVPASQTIKEKARKQVAAEAGVTPAAVKQAEKRVKSKNSEKGKAQTPPDALPLSGETGADVERASVPSAPVEPSKASQKKARGASHESTDGDHDDDRFEEKGGGAQPGDSSASRANTAPPIDLLGETVAPEWVEGVRDIRDILDATIRQLRNLLTNLDDMHATVGDELRASIKKTIKVARAHRPAVLCVTCRAGAGMTDCLSCHGLGWLNEEEKEQVHPASLNSKKLVQKETYSGGLRRNQIVIETPDGDIPFVDVPDPTDEEAPF